MMQLLHDRCAGLDVHKKTVVACALTPEGRREIRSFGTMTGELLELVDWLQQRQIIQVAMESTGVYWKPIYNLLEGGFEVLLVNAKHIKFVPGRKTDVKDAQWIAELLQHGLLKASFIPPAPQRELRELVRYRSHLIEERSREVNRVHKVLEDANLKLTSVATDVLGASGREMLSAIIAGKDDPTALAQLAKGRLRQKISDLQRALTGRVKDTHRLLLKLHLEHIDDLNAKLQVLEEEIAKLLTPFDHDDLLARLQTIPGVGQKVAQVIVAEVGTDMSRFHSAGHLAAWAGLTPGKHESAGRNRSARTHKANRYLKTALVEAANSLSRSTTNFLAARFRRLKARRGQKRAAVALARSILEIAYHLMTRGGVYVDLGTTFHDQRQKDKVQQRLVKRLEDLGFQVSLQPTTA
jgi:transposase